MALVHSAPTRHAPVGKTTPMSHDGAMELTRLDIDHLTRCVELAEEGLEAGDEPFGSILVDADGVVLYEGRNHVAGGDSTAHPELAIAQWALGNLEPERRSASTVYTSGEHCPMCAGAHGWAGLGRIVFAASAAMLDSWRREWGAAPGAVAALPINLVVPGIRVDGPADELVPRLRYLHFQSFQESQRGTASAAGA